MRTYRKIIHLNSLKNKLRSLRKKKKIAFTNGCFDILHYGHVSYLEAAKREDRILIIGLNSDNSIRRIKGPLRPIIGQKERAALLASMACVDYVVVFNDDTPLKLIKELKPDILIKGADWKRKAVVGSEIVKSYGGKVEYIKYLSKFSTTNIIEKIVKQCPK